MAKRKTNTLSDALVTRLQALASSSNSANPPSIASTPYPAGRQGGLWLKIGGGEEIENGKREYTADVYTTPFGEGTDARIAIGVKARNVYEIDNTAATQAGYTIVADPECGDISGIEPIPAGSWHESLGVYDIDGDPVHAFKDRNDPIIEGPA